MKRFVKHTLAVACLAAAAGPAFATASSSAVFGNLVITLTDLNPTDGIAPSLTYITKGQAIVVTEGRSWGDTHDDNQYIEYGHDQQGTVKSDMLTDWSHSTATVVAARNVAGFTSLSAQGVANSGLDGYGGYYALANGAAPALNLFTLSANTAVTFSVMGSMHVMTSMGYNLDADTGEYAYSDAVINVLGNVNGNFQVDSQERSLYAGFDVRDDNTTFGQSDSWSGQLSVSFYNYGQTDTTAEFQAFVKTEGQSGIWDGVTPVPEPETYAMLLGGLALVGGVARRRRAC
jgi:hypothetical protein